jgi:hypothetical protein
LKIEYNNALLPDWFYASLQTSRKAWRYVLKATVRTGTL